MKLSKYSNFNYDVGTSLAWQIFWYFFGAPLVACRLFPSSWARGEILKFFGATVGANVTLKPGIRIKYPWKISIGDETWIGEDAWLDSIGRIDIGSNVCISQGVYICSGSHDWCSETFDLKVQSVVIEDSVWLAAKSSVAPGVSIGEGAVLTFGSVATRSLDAWGIFSGMPATYVKARLMNEALNGIKEHTNL